MNRTTADQTDFVDFYLPYGAYLEISNRWCQLAEMLPWVIVESCYVEKLCGTVKGAPANRGRRAYAALSTKDRLEITNEETVEQISVNPYLQYFLGLRKLLSKALFHPSMMVHFLSHFSQEDRERTIAAATGIEDPGDGDGTSGSSENSGKLLVDETCTPADVRYPHELGRLNQAREKSDLYIDQLDKWATQDKYPVLKKPKTYRQKARKQYLAVARQKSANQKKIRNAIAQQLSNLRRNFVHIDRIAVKGKFGNCKRNGRLGRIMAKLDYTSETMIHVAIAALKLNKWLAALLLRLFVLWKGLGCFLSRQIVSNLNRCSDKISTAHKCKNRIRTINHEDFLAPPFSGSTI
jgi:hypothetical protein